MKALEELRKIADGVNPLHIPEVPWFPTKIEDFDYIGKKVLSEGDGIQESDHPSFRDKEYRKRRDSITNVALKYNLSDP